MILENDVFNDPQDVLNRWDKPDDWGYSPSFRWILRRVSCSVIIFPRIRASHHWLTMVLRCWGALIGWWPPPSLRGIHLIGCVLLSIRGAPTILTLYQISPTPIIRAVLPPSTIIFHTPSAKQFVVELNLTVLTSPSLSPSPKANPQIQKESIKSHHPTHLQLLSMKEASDKKAQRV